MEERDLVEKKSVESLGTNDLKNKSPYSKEIVVFLVIVSVLVSVFVAYKVFAYFSNTPSFWLYWSAIAFCLVLAIWLSVRSQNFREMLLEMRDALVRKRSSRVHALFALAIILTISACLAGFGQPLFQSSWNELSVSSEGESWQKTWDNIWYGTNYTNTQEYKQEFAKKMEERRENKKKAEKEYSSWAHTIIALFMWIFAIFYWLKWRVSNLFSSLKQVSVILLEKLDEWHKSIIESNKK
jgi:hypothetical protein